MAGKGLQTRIWGLIIAETVIIYGGIILAVYLRVGFDGASFELIVKNGLWKAALASLICISLLYLYDLYDLALVNNRRELFLRLLQSLGIAWAVLALMFYFAPPLMIGRGVAVLSMPIILGMLLAWRAMIHYLAGHPDIGEKVLIVGSGDAAIDTERAVSERRDAGFRVVGFVTDDAELIGKSLFNRSAIGLTDELEQIVRRENIDRVVIAIRDRRGQFPTEQLLKMSLSGEVHIEECASFYERLTGEVYLEMLRPSWLIFDGRGRETRISQLTREIVHRTLALTGLLISLPIIVITAILIRFESKGGIFYMQERVGKNGKPFNVIKFRSMRTDAEKDGPVWAANNDDRTTRVGRIIRKIRVDEIPQFWNILKGEMSFVGPRPERPHFVEQLAEVVPYYEQRHLTAPGLTGWAQVKYPYGASVEDARRKLQFDLYYIKNQSLTLDLLIVIETVKTVLFGRGR